MIQKQDLASALSINYGMVHSCDCSSSLASHHITSLVRSMMNWILLFRQYLGKHRHTDSPVAGCPDACTIPYTRCLMLVGAASGVYITCQVRTSRQTANVPYTPYLQSVHNPYPVYLCKRHQRYNFALILLCTLPLTKTIKKPQTLNWHLTLSTLPH